jgi:thiazolinyl imide reductase
VVVCGTKFGRVYLAAFSIPEMPFELAGILGRGSRRTAACAAHYGVSVFDDPRQVPSDVDIACVVVGSGVNGGRGTDLALDFMNRGMHVLQEHPVHAAEIGECLRHAHRNGVTWALNTHYVHLQPVRAFIAAARTLLAKQRLLFVDAACSFQTAYSLFDILGAALGGVTPWALAPVAAPPPELRQLTDRVISFRSIEGVIAGVPLTLRIQRDIDPTERDNHAHILHRVTLGTEGGTLSLANSHGPVLWCPRAHLPADAAHTVRIEDSSAEYLDFPSATSLDGGCSPSYRQILRTIWPAGVKRALLQLRRDSEEARSRGQYYVEVARLWQEAMKHVGPPVLMRHSPPEIISAAALLSGQPGVDE